MKRLVVATILLFLGAILFSCGSSDITRVNNAVIAEVKASSGAKDVKIIRCEKGKPSKQIIEEYNSKSVYCVKCQYISGFKDDTLTDKNTNDTVFVIEMQTGEFVVMSIYGDYISQLKAIAELNIKDPKLLDEMKDKAMSGTAIRINKLWDSSCPFSRLVE